MRVIRKNKNPPRKRERVLTTFFLCGKKMN